MYANYDANMNQGREWIVGNIFVSILKKEMCCFHKQNTFMVHSQLVTVVFYMSISFWSKVLTMPTYFNFLSNDAFVSVHKQNEGCVIFFYKVK